MAAAQGIRPRFESTLKRLRIIHLALMAGMIVLAVIAYMLQQRPLVEAPAGNSLFVYLVPLLALSGYFSGLYVFKWLLKPLTAERELGMRLARYQSANLLQYSCLEIPALLALLAYIIEGHLFYGAIALFLIIYLFTLRPGYGKMLRQIPLGSMENEILRSLHSKST